MFNAQPIQLRHEAIFIKELTIGEIMQIAKIPEALNEMRISSFISFATKDNTLAGRLTVQERYFILLNWLAISDSAYSMDGDTSEYFIAENKNIPDFFETEGVYTHHLLGQHVSALQRKCENAYEWLTCQMACQLSGDMTAILSSGLPIIWAPLTSDNDNEIDEVITQRFTEIEALTDVQFNKLYQIFAMGTHHLRHLVDISLDNKGITLVKGGDGEYEAVRFRPLAGVSDIARQLAECFA